MKWEKIIIIVIMVGSWLLGKMETWIQSIYIVGLKSAACILLTAASLLEGEKSIENLCDVLYSKPREICKCHEFPFGRCKPRRSQSSRLNFYSFKFVPFHSSLVAKRRPLAHIHIQLSSLCNATHTHTTTTTTMALNWCWFRSYK